MTGGTEASRRGGNKAAVTVHGRTQGDPWRAATSSQTPSSPRKTLSVSPEDDLRPPASKTLSVSPYEGETLFPEVANYTGPCVSPLHRGEQEGSCGARSLRFPHRLTDPRGEGEHRPPAGPPSFRKAGTRKQTGREQGRCQRAWTDPGRAATPSQTPSSRRETLSVSLQRTTYGPLQARPSLSLPTRERTRTRRLCARPPKRERPCSRRLRTTRARASLPFTGENKRGLAAPGVCDFPIG